MDDKKYQDKANKINEIQHYMNKINTLAIELEEEGLDNTKHFSKLTKGLGFINFFIIEERVYMKELKKKHYKALNSKQK